MDELLLLTVYAVDVAQQLLLAGTVVRGALDGKQAA
jgi:hypothetical protein